MNGRQTIILIAALVVSALIVWHDLPIEFPWMINVVKLFLKLSVVLGFAVFAFVFFSGFLKLNHLFLESFAGSFVQSSACENISSFVWT